MDGHEGHDRLAERFEAHRDHLRAVAYRMLGSASEADDAVQEAWLRLSRSGGGVDNLGGWLTTVVARVCLDQLRARRSRREEPVGMHPPEPPHSGAPGAAEEEAALADSVGLALLVVLDALAPAERIAFVLHDAFGVPFDEIAGIVGRSPTATRQLASRARRRVRGRPTVPDTELGRHRHVVEAFLAALRSGDREALIAVLDPELVAVAELPPGSPGTPGGGYREVRGARRWAEGAVGFARMVRFARPALVDGAVGVVMAPRGRLFRVLRLTLRDDRIAAIDVIADPERLARLEIRVLDG